MWKKGQKAEIYKVGDYLCQCEGLDQCDIRIGIILHKDVTIFQVDSIDTDLYLHLKVVQAKPGSVFDELLHDGTSIRTRNPPSVVLYYVHKEEGNFENILKL